MKHRDDADLQRTGDQLELIAGVLKSGRHFLLSSHVNPDGDSVGSTCALYLLLSRLGKEVHALFQHEVPAQYRFVPGSDRILWGDAVRGVMPSAETVGVILDCGELSRTGEEVGRTMARCGHLVIVDHHATPGAGVDGPGRPCATASQDASITQSQDASITQSQDASITTLVDGSVSATGELVYYLVRKLLDRIPPDIATALYVAISTDTGSFRYASTSPSCLRIAGELVEAGALPGVISEMVYDTKPMTYLRFLSDALGRLKTAAEGLIAYLVVTDELLQAHAARSDDLEGLVNYARMVDTAVCAILFSPGSSGEVKVSFRCKGGFRVDSIAAHFGGGGHRCASGARVHGRMEDVVDSVVSYVSAALTDHREQD